MDKKTKEQMEKQISSLISSLTASGYDDKKIANIVESTISKFYNDNLKVVKDIRDLDDDDIANATLTIHINPDNYADKQTMVDMLDKEIPVIKQLLVTTMERFTANEKAQACEMFEHLGGHTKIKYLTLNTGSDQFDNLDIYIDSLAPLLQCVVEEVYLYAFDMSNETLCKVISNSYNAKRVVILWCRPAETSQEYEIDSSNEYRLKSLNIFWTFYNGAPGHMGEEQFTKFVEAMSNTNIIETLRHIQCGGDWYSTTGLSISQVQKVFSSAGFERLTIVNSHSQPMIGVDIPADSYYDDVDLFG